MPHFNPQWLQRPRKKDNPEGRIALQILKYLRAIGAVAGKTKTMGVRRGNFYSRDPYLFLGFPDITFFYNNRLYFCEVKSPTGQMSEHQKSFQEYCIKSNIPYILAKSLEDIISIIK